MHIPPDWGVFATLLVSFLAFWMVFGWIFFGPFLKLLGDREHRLKDLNERTERLLEEERTAVREREQQLAAIRRDALARLLTFVDGHTGRLVRLLLARPEAAGQRPT